jgi:pimeloyl-ACP methyl ester carboxylesterase
VFVFDLGGLTAEVLNGSAAPFEVDQAPIGAPYVLFEGSDGDHPVWDCSKPIGIAVNLHSVPIVEHQVLLKDLMTAVEDINENSVFRLYVVGQTTAVPSMQWAKEWDTYAPAARVVVSFGDATDTDLFEPGAAAMGGLFARRTRIGEPRAFAGFVYVDTAHLGDYQPGRGYRSRVGLFTHELLHVLGLGHVHPSHADSILTPSLSESHGELGPGDRAGLRRLAEIGCPDSLP